MMCVEDLTKEDLVNLNAFYKKERNNRLLYHVKELHTLIISLIICLLITPSRGTLDEHYCSINPFLNNKTNILYILHCHLNHQNNQSLIPQLSKHLYEIKPIGSGQRLLKLLCKSLFDVSKYKGFEFIAKGSYGTVFKCFTDISEPSEVAIKKIDISKSILGRCDLFDIFTEVTALEMLRLEGCVTHLFDYGVDSNSYYIVIKKYDTSLREWRLNQKGKFEEMLPIYLNIFQDILKQVEIIHNSKITHYDLKCDNIMIEINEIKSINKLKNESNSNIHLKYLFSN